MTPWFFVLPLFQSCHSGIFLMAYILSHGCSDYKAISDISSIISNRTSTFVESSLYRLVQQPWHFFGIVDWLISCFVASCPFPLTSCNVSGIIGGCVDWCDSGIDFSFTDPWPTESWRTLSWSASGPRTLQSEERFGGPEDALWAGSATTQQFNGHCMVLSCVLSVRHDNKELIWTALCSDGLGQEPAEAVIMVPVKEL